jgi:hypothetical protein
MGLGVLGLSLMETGLCLSPSFDMGKNLLLLKWKQPSQSPLYFLSSD